MPWLVEPALSDPARVLLVSQRGARYELCQALRFEFEDLARTFDAVELTASDRERLPPRLVRSASALLDRASPGLSAVLERDHPSLDGRYDLLIVTTASLSDLLFVRPLSWLRRKARVSICLVDEVWRKGLERRIGELRLLRDCFDHIFVGTEGSVEPVAELARRPCTYLPPSVDALALCPFPAECTRPIDLYWMGRRSPPTHEALLGLAEQKRWFYLYDSTNSCRMADHRAHRRLLGTLLKRSRCFFAYPGKANALEETGGQQEIGYRYFEGAAAGVVMIGEAPRNPWFEKLFGWPDAVIHLPYGATDPEVLTAALDLSPERERAIRRTNVIESLRRHDHVYRWAELLRHAGLPETPGMEQRRRQLRDLAEALSEETRAPAGRVTRIS